jgi:hypothetical protein
MIMLIVVVFSIIGNIFLTSQKKQVRTLGFLTCLLTSISWLIYLIFIHDMNVIFQFVAYCLVNAYGVFNNFKSNN